MCGSLAFAERLNGIGRMATRLCMNNLQTKLIKLTKKRKKKVKKSVRKVQ